MKHYRLPDGSTISYPDYVVNFELSADATEITETEMLKQQKIPEPPVKTWLEKRLESYPTWHELADAIVEEKNGNPTAMKRYLTNVAEIKKMYPKD